MGTLNFKVYNTDNGVVTISSYGDGDLPTISTYKYITGTWEEYSDNIYRIDISDTNNYTGYTSNETHAYNVGFIEDDTGTKYYNKKVSIDHLENNFDFYSDGKQYLYMYLDNGNPYEKIGNVKAVVRSNLMTVDSNMDIKNIRFSDTGGHAIEGGYANLSNITIENCIIENIGGSYLYSTNLTNDTRYGNGIEFYNSNVRDITIKNNIIRNVYDVAFTIQGTSGSGTNVNVYNNVMVNNSQDSEIWESGSATGVVGYKYYNNISINQGRGWGYDARPDQYASAAILFWGYHIDNTDIEFTNNLMYNPRRIYFAAYQNNTNEFFKQADKIKSDHNTYYLGTDAKLFREEGSIFDTSCLEEVYNKDANSTFSLIEVDDNIIRIATTSNEISKIRKLFGVAENITSEKYKIEENDISKIAPETTVATFKQNVVTGQEMVFIDKEGNVLVDEDIIATGTTLKVGNTLQYTLVVIGDVDLNGNIDINDLAKLKLHYIEYELLTGASLKAADVDQDEEITINDIAQIKLILIGLMEIE